MNYEQRYHPWVIGAIVVDVQFWRDYGASNGFASIFGGVDTEYVIFTQHYLPNSVCRALIAEHALKYADLERRRRARLLPVPLKYSPRRWGYKMRIAEMYSVAVPWDFTTTNRAEDVFRFTQSIVP